MGLRVPMSTELPFEHSTSLDEVGVDEVFFGRDKELQAIAASMGTVLAGTGHIDVISGPAGIGKTRLAREVAASARTDGFQVLRGGCWEGDGAPSYWPWIGVLRSYLEAAGDEAATGSEFSRLLEAASARVSVVARATVDASKDAQQARFVLFDWVCEFFAGVTARQPIMLVLDNLHWADTGSLLLLQFVVGRLATLPIAIIATSRDPLPDLLKSVIHHEEAEHLPLPGLSREEVSALLTARSAYTPVGDVLDQLMGLTEGNPYFLRELAQLWRGGHGPTDASAVLALPPSLLALTLQQFDRLSFTCRRLLQAASVIGREFDAELVTQVAEMAMPDAMRMLDDAAEHRVLVPLTATRYCFRHALVREAIQGQVNLAERTRLHERIAIALEQQVKAGARVPATALAHHFSMGLPFTHRRRAGAYSITAGEEAHAAFAYEEAVFQFRRAQEMCWTTFSDTEACDLLLRLGAAEAGAGASASSRHTFENAAAFARRLECPQRFTRAALGFKGLMWATIPVDYAAVALLEEARSRLTDACEPLEVQLLASLSKSLYYSHHTDRARQYSERASLLAATQGDPRLKAIALETHAVTLLRPDTTDALLAVTSALTRYAEELRDPDLLFNANLFRQFSLLTTGDIWQADQALLEAAGISQQTRNPRFLWQIALLRTARATLRGQLALAEEMATTSQTLGRRVHDSSPGQHDLLQTLQRALLRNDVNALLEPAAALVVQSPTVPGFKVAYSLLLARASQISLASELLHELAPGDFHALPRDNLFVWLLTMVAEATVLTRQRTHAATAYRLLLPYAEQQIVAAWGTVLDGCVSHYLAILAAFLAMDSAAIAHFSEAIVRNRTVGAPALTARSQVAYAQFALARSPAGCPDDPCELARAAEGTFTSLSFPHYAHLAATVRQQASTDYKTFPATGTHDLPLSENCFRRTGDFWTIQFEHIRVTLKHSLGLQYIATLLSRPGEAIHVLELIAPPPSPEGFNPAFTTSNDKRSDDRARTQYRHRLREISVELDEAEAHHDLGMTARLTSERAHIMTELAGSFGLRGRGRPFNSEAERARISVRNRISSAFVALTAHHPSLARQLRRAIRTGVACTYDPLTPVRWIL